MAKKQTSLIEDLFLVIVTIIGFFVVLAFKLTFMVFFVLDYCSTEYQAKTSLKWYNVYFNKGHYGEFKLFKLLCNIYGVDNVFCNVYLDNEKTTFTEIDMIAMDKNNIYVFEMKYYKGWIYANESARYWTQTFNRATKNQFYNPQFQNNGHIKALNNLLELDISIYQSVIVFSDNCKFKTNTPINVMNLCDVRKYLNSFDRTPIDALDSIFSNAKSKIKTKTNVSAEIKKQHIAEIKNYKKV